MALATDSDTLPLPGAHANRGCPRAIGYSDGVVQTLCDGEWGRAGQEGRLQLRGPADFVGQVLQLPWP